MSSKIGLILSMLFVSMFFLLGCDLLGLQIAYSELDSKSISISYLIAEQSRIDDEFKNAINNRFNVRLVYDGTPTPLFGEVISYNIESDYKAIFISREKIVLRVDRSTVVGYFG